MTCLSGLDPQAFPDARGVVPGVLGDLHSLLAAPLRARVVGGHDFHLIYLSTRK
jgi:hypothetical protein